MINIFIIVVAVGGGDGYGGIIITITGGINIHKKSYFHYSTSATTKSVARKQQM